MMSVNDIYGLLFALSLGIVLGTIFFGGLWWTVRKGLSSNYAGLWFLGSLLLRSGICLGGFYFIGRDHPERLLICLTGFIVARMIIIRLTVPSDISGISSGRENDNAA